MNKVIAKIQRSKKKCYFISPHLDDAILSAGTLINCLASSNEVHVVNIFTSVDRRSSLSGKIALKKVGYKTPESLFKARRIEDGRVFSYLGLNPINLGYVDALWRKKRKSFFSKFKFLFTEFSSIYPTYKFHVIKGKVSQNDREMILNISADLNRLIKNGKDSIIFCPLALGNHVDHIIAREVCGQNFADIYYWADFPYSLNEKSGHYENFIETFRVKKNDMKETLVKAYKSQFIAMFPNSKLPDHSEIFYRRKNKCSQQIWK